MKIKKGANIQGIDLKMRPVLIHASRVWAKHGKELVVTCGLNGAHSAGSLHYYGLALDFRTRYFDQNKVKYIAGELRSILGADYDVIVHSSHIHVEYDPDIREKRG